ncbi:MAG: hypothetical protein IPK67_01105 [Planctomycetes bacterium]|nr:hypothetical protein [Planctomycetota bacterium]
MNLKQSVSAVLIALALAACNSDPQELINEGLAALNSGKSADALEKFDKALGQLKPEDALYVDAKLGLVESMIEGQPKQAADELLALAKSHPAQFGEKQIVYISGKMVSARKYVEAVDLVHESIQRAGGESPALMAQIELIKKNGANDKGANDKLKSLGYL